mmetsp:Transcript_3670/g.4918  ORF Transcript_3670/g.4918 Transcript_3670/m.4918 type:complete len:841 (+) Transcript_3670:546-3068(+)
MPGTDDVVIFEEVDGEATWNTPLPNQTRERTSSVNRAGQIEGHEDQLPPRLPKEGFVTLAASADTVPASLAGTGAPTSNVNSPQADGAVIVDVPPKDTGTAEFLRKRSFDDQAGLPQNPVMAIPATSKTSSFAPQAETVFAADVEVGKSIEAHGKPNAVSPMPAWQKSMIWCVDGIPGTIFMTLVTIWALFGDDVRLITTYKEADDGFTVVTILCLIFFAVELSFASLAKAEYFLGFYFWLDLIATLSLLFDIPVIFEALTGVKETDSTADIGVTSSDAGSSNAVKDTSTLARAGRTSRAGTRAGRIVRLVRLIRILKLYKQYANQKENQEVKQEDEELTESRVGQKLSDLTTRRVIIGVLLMLFILPLFDVTTFEEEATLMDGGLEMVAETYQISSASNGFYTAMSAYYENTENMYWIKIAGVDYSGNYSLDGPEHRSLRGVEFEEIVYDTATFAKFDLRKTSELQAWLNICRTIFICIILGLGAMLFSKDANNLVIIPIERMIKKVRDMAENPLQKHEFKEDGDDQQFETKILENAFSKICSLMAVGFGEAGAEIIAENLRNGGELNPMVPGKKMCAIFGFCDIRQFTDATEVLQEGVMEFVNSIAQIVHMEVSLHGGSANKNIGDAFLLVWKFPKECTLEQVVGLAQGREEGMKMDKKNMIAKVADNALATFVVIMAMLKKSAKLRAYGDNEALCARIPNYMVKMGFGLHVGWAIEGAIGSEYKVDASYLSPNVNMAARLEAATKQFGTPLLLSQDFVSIMSAPTREKCRKIDRVTVKGSTQPMGLFTYDVDLDRLVSSANAETPCIEKRHFGRRFRENEADGSLVLKGSGRVHQVW